MFKQFAAAALAVSISTGALAGDVTKSSQFLTWPAQSQKAYISTAATAAAVIANLNTPRQAKCIDDWGGKYAGAGYPNVIDAMKGLPDYHPMAVTLSVIQKECGPLKYATASAALQ